MENIQDINEYLRSGAEKDIKPKRNNPILWVALAVIGLLLLFVAFTTKMSDSLQTTILFLGVSCFAVGVVAALVSCRRFHYVYRPTGKKLKATERYLPNSEKENVRQAMAAGNVARLQGLKPVVTSNTLLRTFTTDDGQISAAQLFEYNNYDLQPVAPAIILRHAEVAPLSAFLKKATEA
ncbi:MAG: hypothetical protein SPJ13_05200 [Bacteroidales bacterium]|nr:hypothetical protein [Bacteroidales bacterium]